MKKIYKAPKAQKFIIEAECMLAASPASINIVESDEIDDSASFSNNKAWNSENWSATDEN